MPQKQQQKRRNQSPWSHTDLFTDSREHTLSQNNDNNPKKNKKALHIHDIRYFSSFSFHSARSEVELPRRQHVEQAARCLCLIVLTFVVVVVVFFPLPQPVMTSARVCCSVTWIACIASSLKSPWPRPSHHLTRCCTASRTWRRSWRYEPSPPGWKDFLLLLLLYCFFFALSAWM